MKTLIVAILTLMTTDVFCQQTAPVYYLNSEEIDMENVRINPSSIDEVTVDKETGRGAVYITTKQEPVFLTLDDILKNKGVIVDAAEQLVYIVDDKLVTDKSKKSTAV